MLDLDVCRSCLKKDSERLNLFQCKLTLKWPLKLSECYELCTNIKLTKDDILPQNICIDCLNKLREAYLFYKQSVESEKILKSKLDADKTIQQEEIKSSSGDEINTTDNSENSNSGPSVGKKHVNVDKSNIKRRSLRKKKEIKINEEDPIAITTNTAEPPEVNDNNNNNNVEDLDGDSEEEDEVPISELFDINKSASRAIHACGYCEKTYKFQNLLDKHIQSAHKHKFTHLCNICGKSFSGERTLKSHLLQHNGDRPYKCDDCDKSYFTRNGLHIHSFVHQPEKRPTPKQYLCSECGKEFSTNQRLRIHSYVHTGEKNFSCANCDKTFATEFRLRSHQRIHSGEKPYQCPICGICFAQGNALKCHKRIHSGEKPYKCKYCNMCFSQNTILKTHMTLHTGKTVECPDCDKKFSRASYLILHRREHTGEKPYACDQCPNRYKQKSHLDRHLDTHYGIKHKCNVCNKEYSKQWSLKMHMYTHSNEKPYKCTECSMAFVRRDKYKTHLKIVHGRVLENSKNHLIVVKPETIEEESEEIEYIEEYVTSIEDNQEEHNDLDSKKNIMYMQEIVSNEDESMLHPEPNLEFLGP